MTATKTIEVWDLLLDGKINDRIYFDPARSQYMRVAVGVSGEALDIWETPEGVDYQFGSRSFAGFRAGWASYRTSQGSTAPQWKRRAPLTRGHVAALFDAIYDQLSTAGCPLAMSLSRRGLRASDSLYCYAETAAGEGWFSGHGSDGLLGDYTPGEWEHDPGCNEDNRFWNPGYLFVDENSPLIQWLIAAL
jgi:hypothetical protein